MRTPATFTARPGDADWLRYAEPQGNPAGLRLVEQGEYTITHRCGASADYTAAELAAATSLPTCPCEAEEPDPKDAA
jgi:hypothetical protein